jgi:type IV pilus assembly protein PilA
METMAADPRDPAKRMRKPRALVILCVAAAVLGIAYAIFAPLYGDYRHRAQVSEAVTLLSAVKEPLTAYYATHQKWPIAIEEITTNTRGKYTRSVAISKGAGGTQAIELTAMMLKEGVDSRVAGKTILLSSDDHGKSWQCRSADARDDYLPAPCRRN